MKYFNYLYFLNLLHSPNLTLPFTHPTRRIWNSYFDYTYFNEEQNSWIEQDGIEELHTWTFVRDIADGVVSLLPHPVSHKVIVVHSSNKLTGVSAAEFNTPENKAAFEAVVEASLTIKAFVINVVATDISSLRRRRLLVSEIVVTYDLEVKVKGPVEPAVVFEELTSDLAAIVKDTNVLSEALVEEMGEIFPDIDLFPASTYEVPVTFSVGTTPRFAKQPFLRVLLPSARFLPTTSSRFLPLLPLACAV